MQPADLPPGPPPTPELITRLERLERRHDLLWRMVDTLLDQALDAVHTDMPDGQSRETRAAAMRSAVAAAVNAADRLRTLEPAAPPPVMDRSVS